MAVNHYENFPVASILLPREFRRPVALIYRFAREADDFADEGDLPDSVRLGQLDRFRQELRRIEAGAAPGIPWFSALAEVIREHHLPIDSFRDLLSAFSQDVGKKRYADHTEVLDYCRRSANPIGRLLLALYRETSTQYLRYSDAICSSLQIINFLQDVGIDYRNGRIYLPEDEMARFGVTERQIASHDAGGAWWPFLEFQSTRVRELLNSGAPLARALKGRLGLELQMTIEGGNRILDKIARARGDIYRRRPILKPHDWLLMMGRALLAR